MNLFSERNEDRALVRKVVHGDVAAFEKLYRKYAGRLYYFALRFCRCPEDAEETVQEIFIRIWKNRSDLIEDFSFSAYLFTIARNYLFNLNRKKMHEKAYREHLLHYFLEQDNDPEKRLMFRDLQDKLQEAILRLPPMQQKVFRMVRLSGMSHKEVAELLDVTVKTVETHMRLALKKLHATMDPLLVNP